jgi:cytoskeletal protein CcmA (bactofilin family)
MAKDRGGNGAPPESVISIIGPGMTVIGECQTDGTIRIEGRVEGIVRAGKAVVVGRDGAVDGDVITQDAVISGRVNGTLIAESRLELQATCRIDGEVRARRMQLEEGALLNGRVQMGENFRDAQSAEESVLSSELEPDPEQFGARVGSSAM